MPLLVRRITLASALVLLGACSSRNSQSAGTSSDGGPDSGPGQDAAHGTSDTGGHRSSAGHDAGHARDARPSPSDARPSHSDAPASRGDATPVDARGIADAPTGPTVDGASSPPDASSPRDVAAAPCGTQITYGSAWIRPANHPDPFDDASGLVTWDGTCTDDGANSYAVLSNGWQPYFTGHGACIIALDAKGSCASTAPCTTRVTYRSAWIAPAGHAAQYDDVAGRVFASGVCAASGNNSSEALSNGWVPFFQGANACELSFEYTGCGGLYENPVIPTDCPDPGVLYDNGQYILACTSGDAANAYPIYTSPDLVSWTPQGYIFPSGAWPTWAVSDFWAPEIHAVGGHYVAYFSAKDGATGQYSVGAASATSPLGPFTDLGQPLIQEGAMGLIDASEINAADGTSYVLWKEDGNAIGEATPIHSQPLSSDGMSLTGSAATLVTNDQPWEGAVTEAPFMVEQGGTYYLFYSGNSYANSTYAVGVASAASPSGPFTKAAAPIVATGGNWVGPGHCAVVDTPTGDTYMVYAAWQSGCVNTAGCGRLVLTDAVQWGASWPGVAFAPSSATRPLP